MKRTLVLVRHCESDWNVIKRLSGQDNTARLTKKGRDQAHELAGTLTGIAGPSYGAIFSSDLTRALETAAILCERLLLPMHVTPYFREVGLGELDGKTRAEVHALPNGEQHLASLREDSYDFTAYHGEDRESVLKRHKSGVSHAMAWLRTDATAAPDVVAIIVGRGSALRTLLNHYKPGSKLHEQGGYNLVEHTLD